MAGKKIIHWLILCVVLVFSTPRVQAQVALSFSVGPQVGFWYVTHGEWKSDVKPGWGFNSGLVIASGDDKLISFRGLLNYSLQSADVELYYLSGMMYDGSHLEGKYRMSNILFSPQVGCNFLKNKSMYVAIGPFMQYMIYASGSGTYGYYPQEHTPFTGDEVLAADKIFNAFNWGGGLSFGCQKIKAGSINLSLEIRELLTVQSLLKEDKTNAEWLSCMTSLTVGIELFRGK